MKDVDNRIFIPHLFLIPKCLYGTMHIWGSQFFNCVFLDWKFICPLFVCCIPLVFSGVNMEIQVFDMPLILFSYLNVIIKCMENTWFHTYKILKSQSCYPIQVFFLKSFLNEQGLGGKFYVVWTTMLTKLKSQDYSIILKSYF